MRIAPAIRWTDGCRTRRTVLLLGIIWMLGMADLYFTLWAYRFTDFEEMNPWASRLLRHHELGTLMLAKILLVVLSTAAFWIVRKHRLTEAALWTLVAIHVGLIFRWSTYTSNTLEMWAYCPAAPSVFAHEIVPLRPLAQVQWVPARLHEISAPDAPRLDQVPRASGVPAAFFLENSPQNWPKPRT